MAGESRPALCSARAGLCEAVGADASATASAVSAPACNATARPGDEMFVVHVPAQQQDLDQGPGTVAVAVRSAGHSPPRRHAPG
jgi:hypothetical protein